MNDASNTLPALALSASLVLFGLPTLAADNGCSTGGSALADAYVVADPIYATFFGDETGAFVARNRQHFLAQGDSVRCARALANAFAQKAAQVYDPELQAIRNQKRRELEGQGIPIGSGLPDASGGYVLISYELARLVEGLPPAAAGDFERLGQAQNEFEAEKWSRARGLAKMMQLPPFWPTLRAFRPGVEQARELDREMIRDAAAALAGQQ